VFATIVIMWIVLPAVLITYGVLTTNIIDGVCTLADFSSYAVETVVAFMPVVVTYLLPLMMMLFCYGRIVYALRHKVYRVFQETDTQFYFGDNFGNPAPILTILSLLQAEIYGA